MRSAGKYDYICFNLFLYDTIFFAREEHHCLCEHWRDCLRLDCVLNMVFIAFLSFLRNNFDDQCHRIARMGLEPICYGYEPHILSFR